MTRRILIPLDGSPLAERALPHAEALARACGDGLALLRVVTPAESSQSLFWKTTIPAELRGEWEQAALQRADRELRDTAARLRAAGLSVDSEVIAADDAAQAIIERADRDGTVGLVLMASHGRGGLGRWVLGSVAAKVLQAVATPLMLVRPGADAAAAPRYATALVPLDGSAFAEQALGEARLLASATGCALVLATVAAERDDAPAADAIAHAEAYLTEMAGELRADGLSARQRVLAGEPAEQILRAAEQERADMIVMATHGQGGWRALWIGSVASKVVEGASIPVLLVRPSAA